jgi:hypothetical protein
MAVAAAALRSGKTVHAQPSTGVNTLRREKTLRRFLVALMAGSMVFTVALASAAFLSVNGGVLQAGADADVTCSDGVAVQGWALETDTDTVNAVRINGFGDCAGADVFVRLTDENGAYLTGNLVPDDGNPINEAEERFPFSGIDPLTIEDIHVWIEGGGGTAND